MTTDFKEAEFLALTELWQAVVALLPAHASVAFLERDQGFILIILTIEVLDEKVLKVIVSDEREHYQ